MTLSVDIDEARKAEDQPGLVAQLQATLNVIPAHTWYASPSGGLTFVNQRTADYLGLPKDHPLRLGIDVGAHWDAHLAFVHPDDRDETQENWLTRLRTGEGGEGSFRVRGAQGGYRWFLSRAEPLRASDGAILQWVGVNLDIQELKCTEQALRTSEAKIRRLVDSNIIGIFIWDFDGQILEANKAFLDIVGYDHEDLAAGNVRWTDLTPPDWHDRDTRLIHEHKVTGTLQPFEKEYFRKDGSRVPVLIGVATFEEGGDQGVAFVLDLRERKCAEEALRESERSLRSAIDGIAGLVAIMAPNGELDALNRQVIEYFGRSLEEMKSWATSDAIHPQDLPRIAEIFQTSTAAGTPFHYEVRLRRFDGQYRWFDNRSVPIREESGRIVRWYMLGTDIEERKRAEEGLRESEYKLRQIIETVPALLWSSAPDGQLTDVNKGVLEDYFGLRFEDLLHRGWGDLVHPDDLSETANAFTRAIQTGTSYRAVHRLRRAEGDYRWHQSCSEPLRDRHGNIIQWYGLTVDIDEAKKAEDRLRRSEAHLAEVQRLSHTGSSIYNDTAILYWSEEASRIFGFDPLQGIPSRETVWQRIHPDDVAKVNDNIERGVREKRSFTNAFRFIMPDGTVKHIESTNHPVFSANGELLQIVGTSIDVTERKRAEVVGQRLAAIVDSSEDAIISKELNGIIESWNRAAERLFGYQASEVIGKSILVIIPPDRHDEELGILERVRRGESIKPYETVRMRKDGSLLDISLTVSPVRDAAGQIIGAAKIARDITERKHAQQEHERLRQLEADFAHMNRVSMMGELAASLSHEITQPIASARNNARAAQNFLDMQPPDLNEVREALGCVIGDADRAGDIIDRIRDHIKKAPPRKGRFDLNEAINEVIVLGGSAIIKNAVWVQTRLSEGLLPVHGDRVQLQQVVLNLLLNAVEAMGSVEAMPRDLLISTTQDPSGVLVAVRDSGPGIDPEHLERIFKSFYTTKPGGTGMGLAISRSIIDAHGGRLWAEANEPRGTIFQFTLPAVQERP
jgi:PAS domain S-box-containing protein